MATVQNLTPTTRRDIALELDRFFAPRPVRPATDAQLASLDRELARLKLGRADAGRLMTLVSSLGANVGAIVSRSSLPPDKANLLLTALYDQGLVLRLEERGQLPWFAVSMQGEAMLARLATPARPLGAAEQQVLDAMAGRSHVPFEQLLAELGSQAQPLARSPAVSALFRLYEDGRLGWVPGYLVGRSDVDEMVVGSALAATTRKRP